MVVADKNARLSATDVFVVHADCVVRVTGERRERGFVCPVHHRLAQAGHSLDSARGRVVRVINRQGTVIGRVVQANRHHSMGKDRVRVARVNDRHSTGNDRARGGPVDQEVLGTICEGLHRSRKTTSSFRHSATYSGSSCRSSSW
jgi:hypothetical protein